MKASEQIDLIDELAAEEDQTKLDPNKLGEIARLARLQVSEEAAIEDLEKALKEANSRLAIIRDVKLPEAMQEVGLESFTLAESGEIVKIERGLDASLPNPETLREKDPAKRASIIERVFKAYDWLVDNKYDGIVKTSVVVMLGKEDRPKAKKVKETLEEAGFNPVETMTIHPQTLKKFIKEAREENLGVPEELFGVHDWTKAVVVRPKKSKKL